MNKILQIIDANINRAAEGLRVIEEITRFVLEDEGQTRRLKEIRHTLRRLIEIPSSFPLDSRDTNGDAGRLIEEGSERDGYPTLAQANFRRVQEALRVIEEFSKLDPLTQSSELKGLRFAIYNLEKEVLKKVFLIDHRLAIKGLYAIVDLELLGGQYQEFTEAVIEGGASSIQLRGKGVKDKELFKAGQVLRQITKKKGALFIVNDRIDLALGLDADGIHLGQDDLPTEIAQRLLGMSKIVGLSTHNLEEAVEAESSGISYIGFGPIYKTSTKPELLPVGVDLLREVKRKVKLPVIAIGGINGENIQEVIEAGVDGVACASCLTEAVDAKEMAYSLSTRFNQKPHPQGD